MAATAVALVAVEASEEAEAVAVEAALVVADNTLSICFWLWAIP